ncbi:hypothetical protein [Nocardia sp. NPDC058480]
MVSVPLGAACSMAITTATSIKGAFGVGTPMAQGPPLTPAAVVM